MEASGHVGFAANPFGIVWRGAGQSGIEEELAGTPYVDHDLETARDCEGPQLVAEPPGCFLIEAIELKFLFLNPDAREIVGYGHGRRRCFQHFSIRAEDAPACARKARRTFLLGYSDATAKTRFFR
jgi:hypothetical protein